MWYTQTFDLSLSLLTDSSVVLCAVSVFVTTGCMNGYLLVLQNNFLQATGVHFSDETVRHSLY